MLDIGVQYRDAGVGRYLGSAHAVIAPQTTYLTIPVITRRSTFFAPFVGLAARL